MKIKILAETSQEKGKSFERLMVTILDRLGYTGFKTNIHTTGMELDIKAQHKVTNESILCECKAHEDQIDSGDLTNFLGKLSHERSKDSSLKGMFYSISGFTGTALAWYDELNENEKENFKIFGNKEILELLRISTLLAPDEELERAIKKQSKYELGERYLVYFESELYVTQLFLLEGKPHRYLILKGKGNLAYRAVYEEIAKLDDIIRTIPLVKPHILDKVALNLLNLNRKTTNQITTEVVETMEDVKVALDELKTQELVITESDNSNIRFKINTTISALTDLTRRFANSEYMYQFMSSAYIDTVINNTFIDHVADRFKLNLNEEQKIVLIKAARIFPSVLSLTLLGDKESYENSYEHLQELKLPEIKKNEFQQIVFFSFMHDVFLNIINDLRIMPGDYHAKKNISGYYMTNKFKIASESEPIFSIESGGFIYVAKAGGPIKAGQIVSYTDISLLLNIGNTLMALEEYEKAIDEFEQVIKQAKNPDLLKTAWNNKGLCFVRMGKYREALPCFETALSYDNKLIEGWNNKALCLDTLGKKEEARQARENAEKLKTRKN